MSNLSKAREARPEAAAFMEQAIAAKTVTIKITPRRSASSDSSPSAKLHLEVTPSITKQGGTKSIQAMVGQTVDISMTLGALATAASLSLNESVYIAAHEWTEGTFDNTQYMGGSCSVPLPTTGASSSGKVTGGDGDYDVSVTIS